MSENKETTDSEDLLDPVTVLGVPVHLERLVYSTVVLMSVLVVYDGWASLTTFAGTALVIAAPTLALLLAHLFADALHRQAELHRPLRRREWGALVRHQGNIVLAAVPPLLILLVGWVTPADARSTIAVLLWTGVLTLVALASLSAYHAGLRGWRLLASAAVGGVIGLVVISLQVVLKPHG